MIKYKPYTEIETHVTKIKIKGWEEQKAQRNFGNENISMVYSGVVDGRKFKVVTNGRMLLSDVVDKICRAVEA